MEILIITIALCTLVGIGYHYGSNIADERLKATKALLTLHDQRAKRYSELRQEVEELKTLFCRYRESNIELYQKLRKAVAAINSYQKLVNSGNLEYWKDSEFVEVLAENPHIVGELNAPPTNES